jgi:hypothetical protein
MNKKHDIEIESLNLENLDVEELEHRLEMTVAAPSVCYSNSCGTRVVTCGTLSISEG